MLNGGIELMVYARALGVVQEGRISKMQKIGIKRVNMGLDAGTTEILEAQRKNKTTEETNTKAVKLLKNAGMTVHASYIAGALGETQDTLERTIEHMERISSEGNFSVIEFSRF